MAQIINTNPNAVSIETIIPDLVRYADLMNFGFQVAAVYEGHIIPGRKLLGKPKEVDIHDKYCMNRFIGLAMMETPRGLEYKVLFYYSMEIKKRKDFLFKRMDFTKIEETKLIRNCEKLIPFMEKKKSYKFVDDSDGEQFDFYIQIGTMDDGYKSPVFWVCDHSEKSGDDLGDFEIWESFLEKEAKKLDQKYRYVYLVAQEVKEEDFQNLGVITLNRSNGKIKTLCSVKYGYSLQGQFKVQVKTDLDTNEETSFANLHYLIRKEMPNGALTHRLEEVASHIMNYIMRLAIATNNANLEVYLVCHVGGRLGFFSRSPNEFDQIVQAIYQATKGRIAFYVAKPKSR